MGGTCMATCIVEVIIRGGMTVAYKNVCHTPLMWSGESSHMYWLCLGGKEHINIIVIIICHE